MCHKCACPLEVSHGHRSSLSWEPSQTECAARSGRRFCPHSKHVHQKHRPQERSTGPSRLLLIRYTILFPSLYSDNNVIPPVADPEQVRHFMHGETGPVPRNPPQISSFSGLLEVNFTVRPVCCVLRSGLSGSPRTSRYSCSSSFQSHEGIPPVIRVISLLRCKRQLASWVLVQ